MDGLFFAAWRDGRYLGLADLLTVLDAHVSRLVWRYTAAEAIGPHTARLEANDGTSTTTRELMAITGSDSQVIDGNFFGFSDAAAPSPVVVVCAVDSTSWDVYADDARVLDAVATAFPDARTCPSRPPTE